MDRTTRNSILQNLSRSECKELSLRKAAKLLSVNRTSQYYQPKENTPSDEELECKRIIDRFHTDNPAWGARQLASQLQRLGHQVGRRKTARYMKFLSWQSRKLSGEPMRRILRRVLKSIINDMPFLAL